MKGTILLVNGPNLNMLGSREKDIYGSDTLNDIVGRTVKKAEEAGYTVNAFQSNEEGGIVGFIQKEGKNAAGMLLNAGAFTHTSIAIRDAVLSVHIPFIEVHLSNVFARENFRHQSYLSDIAIGLIAGFGAQSYILGLSGLIDFIEKKK
jgi:3-dehydroquinate dehydratase II